MMSRPTKSKAPAKVVRAYSLDTSVVEAVERLAEADNRSVSNMVETLLRRGADHERKRMQLT